MEQYISKCQDLFGITDNLAIKGENLTETMRLLEDFEGKIKCVYIDPPYNTRQTFSHYVDNQKSEDWLNFMKERLVILHRLLSEDGSIWISIDASESHYLKVLCDEVFGRKNFVDEIIWERAYAPVNLKKTLSRSHDSILVYSKNISKLMFNKLPRNADADSRYKNPDNDPRGVWKSGDLSVGPVVKEKVYPIKTPSGRIVYPPEGRCWVVTQSRLKALIKDNRIWFGTTGNNVPSIKRFLSEVKNGITPMTLWKREEVGDSQEAKREVKSLNKYDVFETPKPERLLQRIIHLATNPGDIVLDSFAGSGTTGAVAHKMGRRWIMIEQGDHFDTHIIPRMKLVVDGEDTGGITKSVSWNGGGGFYLSS